MRIRNASFCLVIIFLAAVIVLAVRLFHYDRGALQGDTSVKQETGNSVIVNWEARNRTWGKVVYSPGAPRIISDFHVRRRSGKIHQGIDIWGPPGQPIIAVADGRVIETHIERCWGPTVAIDHGRDKDGKPLIALYGHVQDILVEEGQAVSRGDVVARLDDNHRQFKCIGGIPHLHLQLGRVRRVLKGSFRGYDYFLRDGHNSINPHLLWADGPYRVTCFDRSRAYPSGTLTYPMPCAKAPDLPRSGWYPGKNSSRRLRDALPTPTRHPE